MTIEQWLEEVKKRIDSLDAELIAVQNFAPVGRDRSWLIAHANEKVQNENIAQADQMVKKRQSGIPLAYILEEKEFYGRKFWTRPGVLIPRPETEALIELIKELKLPQRARFLEIGTGSGCIAITLALEFPQSYVLATDVSETALDTAERNDIMHEGRVELLLSDLLGEVNLEFGDEQYDVVAANLPYVNPEWEWLNREGLKFEPREALFVKEKNGLMLYFRLFEQIYEKMKDNLYWTRYVVLEADPCQHFDLVKIARRFGFGHVKTLDYGLLFERLDLK